MMLLFPIAFTLAFVAILIHAAGQARRANSEGSQVALMLKILFGFAAMLFAWAAWGALA
jgi:hypothetical protein